MTGFFFSSRRRHTRYIGDWSSDVCSSDLETACPTNPPRLPGQNVEIPEVGLRSRPRSEERRVGKEWRSRWSAVHCSKNEKTGVYPCGKFSEGGGRAQAMHIVMDQGARKNP